MNPRLKVIRSTVLAIALALAAAGCGAGAPSGRHYAVRGVYDKDLSPTGFDDEAAIGFNFIDSGPYESELARLARRGLKGFVWLGGYSNTTCSFNKSDRWVRSHVRAIGGHHGI